MRLIPLLRRAAACAAALLLLPGCAHLLVSTPGEVYDDAAVGRARLVTRGDVALASVGGTPEEIGAQLGELVGEELRALQAGFFEYVPIPPAARTSLMVPGIPDEHRRELLAVSRAAAVPYHDLLASNVIVDFACTAFVASGAATATGELLFGRNMDFPPCHLLGPATLVTVVRPAERKAFVSIGWPGILGVASGMNEDGLCASILVNFGAKGPGGPAPTPLAFLVREVLETCRDVEEARALLRARPAGSAHFVFLADEDQAAVVTAGKPEARLPDAGLLTCSNGEVSPDTGLQSDERARALVDLLEASRGRLDRDGARAVLGATYLEYIAAQAMVFEPAARAVSLATGTTLRPAALQGWTRLSLRDALRTGDLDRVEVEELPGVDARPHYREHPYPGRSLDERHAREVQARAAALAVDPALDDPERVRRLAAMALQAARSIQDPAQLRGLQRALAGHALAAVERSAPAVDAQGGDPAGAAARLRAVLAPMWLFEGALDPEQARRVDELERRFSSLP